VAPAKSEGIPGLQHFPLPLLQGINTAPHLQARRREMCAQATVSGADFFDRSRTQVRAGDFREIGRRVGREDGLWRGVRIAQIAGQRKCSLFYPVFGPSPFVLYAAERYAYIDKGG